MKPWLIVAIALVLAACGGGGGGGGGGESPSAPTSSGSPAASTTVQFTALNEYLQRATCCRDSNGNRTCDTSESPVQSDVNGQCTVEGGSGVLLVETDNDTLMSASQGVLGSRVTTKRVFVAPSDSRVVSPLTTLSQVALEMDPQRYSNFEAAQQAILTSLGMPAVDTRTLDYIASSNARAKAVSGLVSSALAEGMTAFSGASRPQNDALRASIVVMLDANNPMGVRSAMDNSVLQAIGQAVIKAEQAGSLPSLTYDLVQRNTGIPDYEDVSGDAVSNLISRPAPVLGGQGITEPLAGKPLFSKWQGQGSLPIDLGFISVNATYSLGLNLTNKDYNVNAPLKVVLPTLIGFGGGGVCNCSVRLPDRSQAVIDFCLFDYSSSRASDDLVDLCNGFADSGVFTFQGEPAGSERLEVCIASLGECAVLQ